MKKLIAIFISLFFATLSYADYRMIVPQPPGGGTDVWARIVAKELEKHLGEKIVIVNIPGINDIPGFNEFHNSLRKDPKTIMVAHGGNAESYLMHKVDYNYHDYTPIGLQNLSIIVGRRTDSDPYTKVKFSAGSGMNPDVMAITMLVCGPNKTMEQYLSCYNEKIVYVPGMKGNERRLAYRRGELNVSRETTAAYYKHVAPISESVDWFSHGVLDLKSGKIKDDTNFPGITFSQVFEKKWGVKPAGEFYDAYLLIKSYRDVLQKSLWVDKNNPNAKVLVEALSKMTKDPVSVASIEKDTGKYEWIIGADVRKALSSLEQQTTSRSLKNAVWFTTRALGQDAFYKDNIARNIKK